MKPRPVLVVEDDPPLRRVLELVAKDAGYEVLAASDGEEALAAIEQQRPAVVVLDMVMPHMDGWQFAAELRRRYGRTIPVIVLTAAFNAEQRARDVDADAFLEKPFDIDELAGAIERHAVWE